MVEENEAGRVKQIVERGANCKRSQSYMPHRRNENHRNFLGLASN